MSKSKPDDPALVRQWKLLRALSASTQGRSVQELAQDTGVTERTIRRDLNLLNEAGFPFHERVVENGKKLWRVEAKNGLPEFKITFDEALGLYLANRLLEPLAGTGFWESAQTALKKIRVMLGDTAIRYIELMADAVHVTRRAVNHRQQTEIIQQLLIGLEDRRVVWLTYQSQQATEPVTYDVHPYGLTCHRGALYLIGYAIQHAEIRHWKVARIEQAEVDQMPFAKPDNFNLQTHLANSFGIYSGKEQIQVRIRFDREVARYVQETTWHPSQQLKAQKDGSILASFVLNSTTEIKSWVMSFGSHAVVLEPQTLCDEIAHEIRQLLEQYDTKKIQKKT